MWLRSVRVTTSVQGEEFLVVKVLIGEEFGGVTHHGMGVMRGGRLDWRKVLDEVGVIVEGK